jgi:hypothetical protein
MPYAKGKTSSLGGKHTVTASMGKKPNSTGANVSASAGTSSGARRDGDKSGAPAMGKGK